MSKILKEVCAHNVQARLDLERCAQSLDVNIDIIPSA